VLFIYFLLGVAIMRIDFFFFTLIILWKIFHDTQAKRQRAEYLRQRGRLHSSVHAKWNKQADHLSRKLARYTTRHYYSRLFTYKKEKEKNHFQVLKHS
jgi:hypothetical protein